MFDPEQFRDALIVSCQAPPDSPFHGPGPMALMARAAAAGGARGVRVNGPEDIAAVRKVVHIPVIGCLKRRVPESPVYITPTFDDAVAVARAGADLVALDATLRPRPNGETISRIIARIRDELGLPVVADVDSVEAAVSASGAGATFLATTLAGYTGGEVPDGPDIELVRRIRAAITCPVLAEGRYQNAGQVAAAFAAGAHAVVVGEAITDPVAITRRLVTVARTATGEP